MLQNFASPLVTNGHSPGTYCTKRNIDVFTTERYHIQNSANCTEKAIRLRGTRLATREFVKARHPYRNMTLAAGVCVALIVVLTLWAQRKRATFAVATHVTTILSQANGVPSFADLLRKTTKVDFD